MKIYQTPRSWRSQKLRFLVAELGAEATFVDLDPAKGETRSAEHLARNPMGKLPVIEDEGFVLWESAAMLVYVVKKHGDTRLLPSDTQGEADVLRWLFFNTAHVESSVAALYVERVVKARTGRPEDTAMSTHALADLPRYLTVLDGQLASREWLTGNFSIADISLAPVIDVGAARCGVDLAPYPHLRAWAERVKSRAAWQRSV